MTKDFSHLDTKYSNKRYYAIMVIAVVAFVAALFIGSGLLHNPNLWVVSFMGFCIGMVVLIHWLGGVKPKDILNYQGWCQDEFKRIKEERKREMNKK